MELIKEIIIDSPPTFYQIKKVKKSKELGEDVYDKYYLTANLFYIQNVSYHIVSKITYEVKGFLLQKMGRIPKLEKMTLEIEVHRTTHFDLDNVSYFWKKLFLDVLKTPTPRQIANAKKRNKDIVTLEVLDDDNTKCVIEINEKYVYGSPKLVFRIYGRVKDNQKEMDLFFK